MSNKCQRCGATKHRGRCRKTAAATPVEPAAPEPVTITGPALEMAPGFGFRASVENERLQLEQTDAGGNTDEVVLSRTELRVLIAEYAAWAGLNVVAA